MRRIAGLLCWLTGCFGALSAQVASDSLELPSVEITAARSEVFQAGLRHTLLTSRELEQGPARDLGEILSTHTTVFVKDYGPGSLSSVSFRGTGAEHTRLVWNGLPLNSPALGLTDLALLPVGHLDEVEVIHGGASALSGNFALGGQIRMGHRPRFAKQRRIGVRLGAGSFGRREGSAQATFGNEKLESRTTFQYVQAENDFPFANTAQAGAPEVRQTQAAFRALNLTQELAFRINERHLLRAGGWYQAARRELPPSMTVPQSAALQRDSSLRAFIRYEGKIKNSAIRLQSSWSEEYYGYFDSTAQIASRSRIANSFSELEWKQRFGKILVLGGAVLNVGRARADVYGGTRYDLRGAFFVAGRRLFSNGLLTTLTLRQDWSPDVRAPFAPMVGAEFPVGKFVLKTSAGRTFNLPTLNMKYWEPGGNPNLLPEKGWTGDLGVAWTGVSGWGNWKAEGTVYASLVDNWLQWIPGSSGIWGPVNLKKVFARGLEGSFAWDKQWTHTRIGLQLQQALTLSTNVETHFAGNDQLIGKQLLYTPRQNGNIRLFAHYRKLSFSLGQQWTGRRFTTSDNLRSLPAYSLMDCSLGYEWTFDKVELGLQARAGNVLNVAYQAVEWRAMPGRNFLLQLNLNWIAK